MSFDFSSVIFSFPIEHESPVRFILNLAELQQGGCETQITFKLTLAVMVRFSPFSDGGTRSRLFSEVPGHSS